MKKTIITSVCTLSISVMAAHAQHYDNSSISAEISYFGYPNTATYGQTFSAPNNVLDDWTFYLQNTDGDGPPIAQNFEFFVMAWNGSEATGPVLYQSALQVITASETSPTAFTVNPNLSLTIGDSYVMFINESGLNVGNDDAVQVGGNSTSPLGGAFEYLNNGDIFSEVTTTGWSTWSVPDTAYIADFSASVVPEPSSIALGSLGATALLLFRRRKS